MHFKHTQFLSVKKKIDTLLLSAPQGSSKLQRASSLGGTLPGTTPQEAKQGANPSASTLNQIETRLGEQRSPSTPQLQEAPLHSSASLPNHMLLPPSFLYYWYFSKYLSLPQTPCQHLLPSNPTSDSWYQKQSELGSGGDQSSLLSWHCAKWSQASRTWYWSNC